MKNVFISHAYGDKEIVKELLYFLKDMGVKEKHIVCSAYEGYGVDDDTDILDFIKTKLSEDTLAVFVISQAFYDSSTYQSQLGAVWAKTSSHMGVLIPPMEYGQVTYAFTDWQCIPVFDENKLNLFYDGICKWFRIRPMEERLWEKRKKRFLSKMRRTLQLGDDSILF